MPKKDVVKKDLLDLDNVDKELTIEAKFALNQVILKDDKRWRMKLVVWKILPRSYHDYTMKFVVDEEPFEKRIKSVEEKKKKIENEPTLFDKMRKKEITDCNELIREIKDEMREMEKQCPTIEFVAEIEEIKYKDGNTVVLMTFPDTIINVLNDRKHMIPNYKLELLPLF